MFLINLILTFLIIIIIIIILSLLISNFCDRNLLHIKIKFIPADDLGKYKVDAIGIARSMTRFLSSDTNNINCHMDIIMYAHDSETFKHEFIILCQDWYNKSINPDDPIDPNDLNHPYKQYVKAIIVEPNDKLQFKINGYKYRITEFHKLSKENWIINDVYDVLQDLLKLPYHRLKFNCHHVAQLIIDIVTDTKHKINLKHFEFIHNNIEPLTYVYVYLKDVFGCQVIEKCGLKYIKKLIKNKSKHIK